MCIASVRDCRALAAAQPVDVTSARIPWFISSHAGQKTKNKTKQNRLCEYAKKEHRKKLRAKH